MQVSSGGGCCGNCGRDQRAHCELQNARAGQNERRLGHAAAGRLGRELQRPPEVAQHKQPRHRTAHPGKHPPDYRCGDAANERRGQRALQQHNWDPHRVGVAEKAQRLREGELRRDVEELHGQPQQQRAAELEKRQGKRRRRQNRNAVLVAAALHKGKQHAGHRRGEEQGKHRRVVDPHGPPQIGPLCAQNVAEVAVEGAGEKLLAIERIDGEAEPVDDVHGVHIKQPEQPAHQPGSHAAGGRPGGRRRGAHLPLRRRRWPRVQRRLHAKVWLDLVRHDKAGLAEGEQKCKQRRSEAKHSKRHRAERVHNRRRGERVDSIGQPAGRNGKPQCRRAVPPRDGVGGHYVGHAGIKGRKDKHKNVEQCEGRDAEPVAHGTLLGLRHRQQHAGEALDEPERCQRPLQRGPRRQAVDERDAQYGGDKVTRVDAERKVRHVALLDAGELAHRADKVQHHVDARERHRDLDGRGEQEGGRVARRAADGADFEQRPLEFGAEPGEPAAQPGCAGEQRRVAPGAVVHNVVQRELGDPATVGQHEQRQHHRRERGDAREHPHAVERHVGKVLVVQVGRQERGDENAERNGRLDGHEKARARAVREHGPRVRRQHRQNNADGQALENAPSNHAAAVQNQYYQQVPCQPYPDRQHQQRLGRGELAEEQHAHGADGGKDRVQRGGDAVEQRRRAAVRVVEPRRAAHHGEKHRLDADQQAELEHGDARH